MRGAAAWSTGTTRTPPAERDTSLLTTYWSSFEIIWWTGLASWEFEFPFPGSLIFTLPKVPLSSNPRAACVPGRFNAPPLETRKGRIKRTRLFIKVQRDLPLSGVWSHCWETVRMTSTSSAIQHLKEAVLAASGRCQETMWGVKTRGTLPPLCRTPRHQAVLPTIGTQHIPAVLPTTDTKHIQAVLPTIGTQHMTESLSSARAAQDQSPTPKPNPRWGSAEVTLNPEPHTPDPTPSTHFFLLLLYYSQT